MTIVSLTIIALFVVSLIGSTGLRVKGNGNSMIYHVPGCPNYAIVNMSDHPDDRWFLSEQSAENAGYRKSQNCPL